MSRDKILNSIVKSNTSIISNINSQRARDIKSLKEVINFFYKDNNYGIIDISYKTTYDDISDFIKYIFENVDTRCDFKFYGKDQLDLMTSILDKKGIDRPNIRNLTDINKIASGELNDEKISFWRGTNLEKAPMNYIELIYNTGIKNTTIINIIIVIEET